MGKPSDLEGPVQKHNSAKVAAAVHEYTTVAEYIIMLYYLLTTQVWHNSRQSVALSNLSLYIESVFGMHSTSASHRAQAQPCLKCKVGEVAVSNMM